MQSCTSKARERTKGWASGGVLSYLANVSKIASKSLHIHTSGHAKRQASRATTRTHFAPTFQEYIRFLTISVSKITRVRQKWTNISLLLTCFCLNWYAFALFECWRSLEDAYVNECWLIYRESLQKEPPPPIWGASKVFTPIIFRTKKVEKSRLGLIGKNFGKNLWENVSGEKESPQSCRKGARC